MGILTGDAQYQEDRISSEATIIVVPRERFGVAVRVLEAIVQFTDASVPIVYVDAGSPKKVADQLRQICEKRGDKYLRYDEFLTPNQARNLGLSHVDSELNVFIDNDIMVSEGWFDRLVECAKETNADAVTPLTCQKEPLHSEVHQAGGQVFDDFKAFLDPDAANPKLVDCHLNQGEPVACIGSERRETQCFEFHCVLIRKSTFDRVGTFDDDLYSTKEHIDFSLAIWKSGGRILMEPRSVVTYLVPDRSNPLKMADWPFFVLRWSPQWQRKSLKHFANKWGFEGDDYFAARDKVLDWRYREGIAKPILRKVPFLGHRHKFQSLGQALLMPIIRAWGRSSVRRHAKRLNS